MVELFRKYDWFTYTEFERPEGEGVVVEKVRFAVRLVPEPVRRKIETQAFGAQVKFGAQGQQKIKRSKGREARLQKAIYALVDTENVDHTLQDSDEVALFERELKRQGLKVGDTIRFDGAWTDGLRRWVLETSEPLLDWIEARVKELTLQADELEEGNE